MATLGKWIEGVTPDDSVCEVAQHSLCVRLEAVQHYLPLAAQRANEDIEYVHQLRVSTRRAMAALQLYSPGLPKKKKRWFLEYLRRVRRTAGKARDMDVLALSHEGETGNGADSFLTKVRKRRAKAQGPIISIHQKLTRGDRLSRHRDKLLNKVARRKPRWASKSFRRWATKRMRKNLERFFNAAPIDLTDLESLHRFRIQGKELRYAMELLAPAFPKEFREELYPLVEQLQERLGDINDCAVALARFGKWEADTKNLEDVKHVNKLLRQEREKLDGRLREFASWWTPRFADQLQKSFHRLLQQ